MDRFRRHHGPVNELAFYELIDVGRGRRLEAFGSLLVDRPAPGAVGPPRDPARWSSALIYRAGRGWATSEGERPPENEVDVQLAGVTMRAHLGGGGQVGVFPEHAVNAEWLRSSIASRGTDSAPVGVLNLFAHTGLLTLVAAGAGASVVHVDSSRPAVATSRHNASLSGLDDRPVRWIVDDAARFVHREHRRGRSYAGFILDPPTYGHGGRDHGAHGWQFETGIESLIEACQAIADPEAFWILSTHTPGWDGLRLAGLLGGGAGSDGHGIHSRPLELRAGSGAVLRLGAAALFDPFRPNSR